MAPQSLRLTLSAPSNRGAFASEDDRMLLHSSASTRKFRRKIVAQKVAPSLGDSVGGVLCHRFHGQCLGFFLSSPQPPTTPRDTHTRLFSLPFLLSLSCVSVGRCVSVSRCRCVPSVFPSCQGILDHVRLQPTLIFRVV